MKAVICIVLSILSLMLTVYAEDTGQEPAFNMDEQLDALGREELEAEVPEEARGLMGEIGTDRLTVGGMLSLTPQSFFKAIWNLLLEQLKKPARTLASIVGVIVLCALIGGLKTASGENSLSQTFSLVSMLCALTSVIVPVLDCIAETSSTIKNAAFFMLSYIPMFSAALTASGSPVTGASYSVFLFSVCQIIAQIVASTLVPLMGIYLALCITGSLVPDLDIGSATKAIKSIISWTLGFFITIFVGLLSIQTMVAQSADTVTVKATKFMIGSFVPVVGNALSEAFSAAQGCFRLLKTTLGAYGVIVSLLTFIPILVKTVIWYLVANISVVAGDIIGVKAISGMMKSCAGVLGVLIAIIISFALLFVVSTTVVMMVGTGAA